MNKRLNNFEALRIVAMFMVIVLHYLYKGGLLTSTAGTFTAGAYAAWLVESFAIVAVNVYVLITGYFMCRSGLKISRLLEIICQVLWYTLLIPLVLSALGLVQPGSFTLYDLLRFVFPIHMQHYWFVTAYVILMLFVPMLNLAVKHFSKQQLAAVTLLITAFETLPKSILPVKFTMDEAGNNALWLICVYLIGAYIRTYGIPFFGSLKKSLFCYVSGAVAMFASLLLMRVIYFKIDAFGESLNFGFHYNHILCLFSSVALFYVFLHWKIGEGHISKVIGMAAPYTFGVYLLHEHILVRYEWVKWLQVSPTDNMLGLGLNLVWKCLAVLVTGIVLDWVRAVIFKAFGRVLSHTSLSNVIHKMDKCLRN